MTTIAVVINTLNEQANIAACIACARQVADEIIVCDQNSTDETRTIAQAFGARVVTFPRIAGNFVGAPKKYAIEQATAEYILSVDADERVTPSLAKRLRALAAENQYDVVHFRKKNLYFGGYARYTTPFFVPEPLFFRRRVYLQNYSGAEERHHNNYAGVRDVQPALTLGPSFVMEHYAYPTIERYVVKTLGWYARAEAVQAYQQGERFQRRLMVVDPIRFFLSTYLRGGYRDGTRGLILCVLFAVYLFNKQANLWLIAEDPTLFDMHDDQQTAIWGSSHETRPTT